jgi:hypothetical protein
MQLSEAPVTVHVVNELENVQHTTLMGVIRLGLSTSVIAAFTSDILPETLHDGSW